MLGTVGMGRDAVMWMSAGVEDRTAAQPMRHAPTHLAHSHAHAMLGTVGMGRDAVMWTEGAMFLEARRLVSEMGDLCADDVF